MSDRAPDWVVPVMRVGFAARGAVYVVIGAGAITSAWRGGQTEGAKGAIASMQQAPWGMVLIWAVGIGLFAYALWRALAAIMDLDAYGTDAKGIVARIGIAVSALVHGALGVYAIGLVTGIGGGSGGGSVGGGSAAERWTATLMSAPFGQWLVGILGAIVIVAGGFYAWKGIDEKYKKRLRRTSTTERLDPVCKFGLVAHGVVIAIIGGFLIYAAWTTDPGAAGGLQQALETVREVAFGRLLLGVIGLGMIAFAVFCWIEALYRVVPRHAGPDVATLSGRAIAR